ncbi:tumor necrosis factor receptor superfamily member 10A-like [Pseudonaja textilis]|uniref:tumor necrosis factor receptor superfamily member 10A-like n=1 Tax=Pseudonaja textilis TaxID=8673 RepID=UPI000EA9D644|nr:tumor necrosis factor receptor superfamily member 10A-like [Pseudonaja textilis]
MAMGAKLLLALCTVASLLHGATTARLPQMQDPKVTAPMIPDDDTDQFYTYENHECKKCPPGTFVLKPCTVPRTEGTCQPCENNTFYKLANSFGSCFGCRVCRILDEVEIKKCTATTNTKCACMNGTFCLPDQPCETCIKCMTSCGPGERKVKDCMPTSDIQCLPDATSSSPTSSPGAGDHGLAWLSVIAVVVVLAVVLVLGVIFCRKRTTTFRNACAGFWSLKKRSSPEPSEERDNMLNMQRNQRSEILPPRGSTANGQALERMTPLTVSSPSEVGRGHAAMKKLVPVNGRNPTETLSRSFDTFINKVPPKDWKRFMRLLKLTDNEIDSAEKSSQYGNEQHYQMLRTWLDKNGQAATLSVLLDVLSSMDLKGIAEEVTSALIAQHFYVYEE